MPLAVIGRPNVGKSSLVNAFLGTERVIVSELAGTTRDSIDTPLEFDGRALTLIDTAGIRRRTKVAGTVDYYAQLRSERAAERADVAIVVCDAAEGITSEDLRVAELAMKTGCATLVALNKWDIGEADLEDAKARLAKRIRQRPPVIACSATDRPRRAEAARARDRARRPPRRADPDPGAEPLRRRGRRHPPAAAAARASGCASTTRPRSARRPPRIAIQVNDRRLITRDWAYHLENRIREQLRARGRAAGDRFRTPKSRSVAPRGEPRRYNERPCDVVGAVRR